MASAGATVVVNDMAAALDASAAFDEISAVTVCGPTRSAVGLLEN